MSAFKNLKLLNDVLNFAQQLPMDYLLEDLLKCESEVEFAEYCIFLEDTNLENPEKFINDLSIWERAILREKAKQKYGI